MPTIETTPELLRRTYERMEATLRVVRDRLKRPLTLAEKILFSHLDDPKNQELAPGSAYLQLRPIGSPCRMPPRRWRSCSSCRRASLRSPFRPPSTATT